MALVLTPLSSGAAA